MHDTALEFGKLFLETYAGGPEKKTIVEVGSRDVNGSIRQFAAPHHDYIGLDFDAAANTKNATRISTASSKVAACVIPTNEEWMIARHTAELL
jgi:acetate kinase